MDIKILIIAVIHKNNMILLRKKPTGAGPYKESWYLLGTTVDNNVIDPPKVIEKAVEKQTGITIKFEKQLSWDTEIKKDLDGKDKFFIYLDCSCRYLSGNLSLGEGIEKLEWVEMTKLKEYDLVPPSVKLFKKLGYL